VSKKMCAVSRCTHCGANDTQNAGFLGVGDGRAREGALHRGEHRDGPINDAAETGLAGG
jgi:hypothetical protein